MEELRAVSEELASGRFADDRDRQRLGVSYSTTGWSLQFLAPPEEAIQALERGLTIYRRLADDNPTVTAYKDAVANTLSTIGFIYLKRDTAKARRYALEAQSVFRSLPLDQKPDRVYVELLLREDPWYLLPG